MTPMTNSTLPTPRPSSSSDDLEQALLALRDLLDSTAWTTEAPHVSARQQATIVLRKHGLKTRDGANA